MRFQTKQTGGKSAFEDINDDVELLYIEYMYIQIIFINIYFKIHNIYICIHDMVDFVCVRMFFLLNDDNTS